MNREHDIDKLFKQVLEGRHFPYQPHMWQEVAQQLPTTSSRIRGLWWVLSVFLLAVAMGLLWYLSATDTSEQVLGEWPLPSQRYQLSLALNTSPTSLTKEASSNNRTLHPQDALLTDNLLAKARLPQTPKSLTMPPPQLQAGSGAPLVYTLSQQRQLPPYAPAPIISYSFNPLAPLVIHPIIKGSPSVLPLSVHHLALGSLQQWHQQVATKLSAQGFHFYSSLHRQRLWRRHWWLYTGIGLRLEPLARTPQMQQQAVYSFGLTVDEYQLIYHRQLSAQLELGLRRRVIQRHWASIGVALASPLMQERSLSYRSWSWSAAAQQWVLQARQWGWTGWSATLWGQANYHWQLTNRWAIGLMAQWPLTPMAMDTGSGIWFSISWKW